MPTGNFWVDIPVGVMVAVSTALVLTWLRWSAKHTADRGREWIVDSVDHIVDKRIAPLTEIVTRELTANNGSNSLIDKVNGLSQTVVANTARLDKIDAKLVEAAGTRQSISDKGDARYAATLPTKEA